jgi:hypothetical protein
MVAFPCSTFSITRFFDASTNTAEDRGPPVIRNSRHNLQIVHSAALDSDSLGPEGCFYNELMQRLKSDWEVVDEGPMEDLLGIEVQRNDDGCPSRCTKPTTCQSWWIDSCPTGRRPRFSPTRCRTLRTFSSTSTTLSLPGRGESPLSREADARETWVSHVCRHKQAPRWWRRVYAAERNRNS